MPSCLLLLQIPCYVLAPFSAFCGAKEEGAHVTYVGLRACKFMLAGALLQCMHLIPVCIPTECVQLVLGAEY